MGLSSKLLNNFQVLKSLFASYKLKYEKKPQWWDLDPKAVSNNELFGYIVPVTQEWSDGLFSWIMRSLANIENDVPKWIVLDGDIDPMWIESLNTVMDDNKVITILYKILLLLESLVGQK